MEWTEESIRLLTAFWADGLSTAEIGRRLGISKNAVVGKAHRLELAARPSPIHWDGPPRQRSKPRPGTPPRLTGATLPPLESTAQKGGQGEAHEAPLGAGPHGAAAGGEGAASGRPAAVFAARPMAATEPPLGAAVRLASPSPAAPRPIASGASTLAAAADRATSAEARRAPAGAPAGAPLAAAQAPAAQPAPLEALKPAPEPTPSRSAAGSARAALQAVASRPFGRVVTCCWPIGEPGTPDFHFCDGRSVPGKPYCEEHAALAYVKVRDRREDAA